MKPKLVLRQSHKRTKRVRRAQTVDANTKCVLIFMDKSDSTGPRRRGDRMSNCVVGSGGSWLPCSTIAEHSVEGCDHFSHDGDDDDLGFFVGVGEAIVEGFEGG